MNIPLKLSEQSEWVIFYAQGHALAFTTIGFTLGFLN